MEIKYGNKTIRNFAITSRTLDRDKYWNHLDTISRLCSENGFTGPLLLTGNDTYVEPWIAAQSAIDRYGVSPLVAINPIFAHPFTVAKMISSLAYIYEKQVFLNMVNGTSLSQHAALCDPLDHDEKYDRLQEFIQVVQKLTRGSSAPATFHGDHYSIEDLSLQPPIPEHLLPEYFIAGHSDAAQKVKEETGSVGMHMLNSKLEDIPEGVRGIHFGLITRETEDDAWDAAEARYPEDERGRYVLEKSMKNTDSVWKKRLKYAADTEDKCANGYWLAPFRSFQADCPYFVGGHERVKNLIVNLVRKGIEHIILEVPETEEDFAEVAKAYALAEAELARDFADQTAELVES